MDLTPDPIHGSQIHGYRCLDIDFGGLPANLDRKKLHIAARTNLHLSEVPMLTTRRSNDASSCLNMHRIPVRHASAFTVLPFPLLLFPHYVATLLPRHSLPIAQLVYL